MKQNPEVSVVIPCYNVQDYIRECLASVTNQSFRDIEIILIDDGSTDNTANEINVFAKENPDIHIKYFFQENKGQGGARNFGVEMASGKYIAFIDADDIWTKNSIERKIQKFQSTPELDVIYSDSYILTNGKVLEQTFKKYAVGYHKTNVFIELLRGNFIPLITVLIKRDVFLSLGGFREGKFIEDYFFWLKAAKYGYRFDFIEEPTAYYRIHGKNTSRNLKVTFRNLINFSHEMEIIFDMTPEELEVHRNRRKELIFVCKKLHYREYLESKSYKKAKNVIKDILKENKNIRIFILFLLTYLSPYLLDKYFKRKDSKKQFYY